MWNLLKPRDNFFQVPARLPGLGRNSRRVIINGNHWWSSVTQFLEKQRANTEPSCLDRPSRSIELPAVRGASSQQLHQGLPPYRDALQVTHLSQGSPHSLLTPPLPSWCWATALGSACSGASRFTASLAVHHCLTSAYPAFLFISQVWLLNKCHASQTPSQHPLPRGNTEDKNKVASWLLRQDQS